MRNVTFDDGSQSRERTGERYRNEVLQYDNIIDSASKRLEEKLEIKTKSQNLGPSSKFETKVTGE
jgi:hypothetical protein